MLRETATGALRQIAKQINIHGDTIALDWKGLIDAGTFGITVKILRPGQEDLVSDELLFVVR